MIYIDADCDLYTPLDNGSAGCEKVVSLCYNCIHRELSYTFQNHYLVQLRAIIIGALSLPLQPQHEHPHSIVSCAPISAADSP